MKLSSVSSLSSLCSRVLRVGPVLVAGVLLCSSLAPVAAEDSVEVIDDPAPAAGADDAAGGDAETLHPTVAEARELAALGHHARAMELLELYLSVHPEDSKANTLHRLLRAEETRRQLQAVLKQRTDERGLVLGDPDYEEAKAQAPASIARRLDMVEYLIEEQRLSDAVDACQRILSEHDEDEATAILLDRLMERLLERERERLERDRKIRNGEVVNDITDRATMPREKRPIPRTVLIFDDDLEQLERQRLMRKLDLEVSVVYDQAPLRQVLQDLFAATGLNFILRDDALGEETLTINVVDETVENVLEIITRSVAVSFNYHGGSVYVTSPDTPILVPATIHLKSGLSNVTLPAQVGSGGGEGGGGEGGGGGFDPFGGMAGGGGGGEGEGGGTDLERFLEAALTDGGLVSWPEGSVYYLEQKSNTLFIRSTPATIAEVRRLIHALDYNAVQVLIEARFVEVSTEALDELGVDWSAVGESGDALFGAAQGAAVNPVNADQAALGGALFTGGQGIRIGSLITGDDLNVSALLSALEQRGKANRLSEPKIMTLNNQQGAIAFTVDHGYIASYSNQSIPTINDDDDLDGDDQRDFTNQVLIPEFQVAQSEIRLTIQPSIARNDDIISLRIKPFISEFLGVQTRQGLQSNGQVPDPSVQNGVAVLDTGVPVFSRRELDTGLYVQHGQTIVLGGLVQETDGQNRSGIPYLSRVPGLGVLFGTRTNNLERSKLLIFVTAHIVDPSGAKYSQEVRELRNVASVALSAQARRRHQAQQDLEREIARQEIEDRAAARETDDNTRSNDARQPGGQRRK